jgi:hypothetical protein
MWLGARKVHGPAPAVHGVEGLPPLGPELAFFCERHADLAWSHMSAVTIHLLARRIPWFQNATASHLASNFLVGPSSYATGDDGVRVDLPRAPLQVALRMAGWQDVNRIPWLPGGELRIRST